MLSAAKDLTVAAQSGTLGVRRLPRSDSRAAAGLRSFVAALLRMTAAAFVILRFSESI
jgi:hypothetical protein